MRPKVAYEWLAFLRERQPHKRLELQHLSNLMVSHRYQQQHATNRLRTLATQYPDLWIVFQTQQRLLGNFTAEDFQ
jgi:hypothetical protein